MKFLILDYGRLPLPGISQDLMAYASGVIRTSAVFEALVFIEADRLGQLEEMPKLDITNDMLEDDRLKHEP